MKSLASINLTAIARRKKPSRPAIREFWWGQWQGQRPRDRRRRMMNLRQAAFARLDRHAAEIWIPRRRAAICASLPPARSSRRNRTEDGRRAGSSVAARSRNPAWSAASWSMSPGFFVHCTSGWRRMVPVAEQGGSTSERRRTVRPLQEAASAVDIGVQASAGDWPTIASGFRPSGRATTLAPAAASCAVFAAGAAQGRARARRAHGQEPGGRKAAASAPTSIGPAP